MKGLYATTFIPKFYDLGSYQGQLLTQDQYTHVVEAITSSQKERKDNTTGSEYAVEHFFKRDSQGRSKIIFPVCHITGKILPKFEECDVLYANEPSGRSFPNSVLVRNYDTRQMHLFTTVDIMKGQEITWCYSYKNSEVSYARDTYSPSNKCLKESPFYYYFYNGCLVKFPRESIYEHKPRIVFGKPSLEFKWDNVAQEWWEYVI